MPMRARKTSLSPLGVLLRMAFVVSLILSAGCGDRGGGYIIEPPPPDTTPPGVLSSSPGANSTGVPVNTAITVTFSEYIEPATVTDSTVILSGPGNTPISLSLSAINSTLTITPIVGLEVRTTYTVCLSTGISDLAGNPLSSNTCWSFSTANNSGLYYPYTLIPTSSGSSAITIGDVTGDGRNDVVLTTSDSHVALLAQNGQGGLSSAVTCTKTISATSLSVGDVNNDGKNELVAGTGMGTIEIIAYNGSGTLTSLATYTSSNSLMIRLANLNDDGLLDVVGIGWGTDTADVFLQNASGTLDRPDIYAVPHGGWDDLEVGDVNNDGLADIVVTSGQSVTNLCVLTQRTDGTFNPAACYDLGGNELTEGVAVGDVNGDALNDIIVTYMDYSSTYSHRMAVFPQNNAGTLATAASYTTYYNPDPVDVADVNTDGRQDIIVLHHSTNNASIYLQKNDGTLGTEELYLLPGTTSDYSPHGFAVGDINSDGSNDIVIAGINSLIVLYHK